MNQWEERVNVVVSQNRLPLVLFLVLYRPVHYANMHINVLVLAEILEMLIKGSWKGVSVLLIRFLTPKSQDSSLILTHEHMPDSVACTLFPISRIGTGSPDIHILTSFPWKCAPLPPSCCQALSRVRAQPGHDFLSWCEGVFSLPSRDLHNVLCMFSLCMMTRAQSGNGCKTHHLKDNIMIRERL